MGVDKILQRINDEGTLAWMFCDDLTVLVPRSQVDIIINKVANYFSDIGLEVNQEKTQVFSGTSQDPFIILGCDLAESDRWLHEQQSKHEAYFNLVQKLPLHPQLKVTLLRMCGATRIKYIMSVCPPSYVAELAQYFDEQCKKALMHVLQREDNINDDVLHDAQGAGFPNYHHHHPKLFARQRNMALHSVDSGEVALVTRGSPITAHPSIIHNLDDTWLWFDGKLTPAEFIAAYSIRLGTVPAHLQVFPCKCDCGSMVTTEPQQIVHTLSCDQFTTCTHSTRHNMVRDAIIREARLYGIACTSEPRCYTYATGKRRPDILFHTATPLVTDITIVSPNGDPGEAATAADEEKRQTHRSACVQRGHVFIPGACESYGLMGKGITSLIQMLAKDLPPQFQFEFHLSMTRCIATALAQSRAAALFGTKWRKDNPSP
jgi:hypothetical protein